MTPAIHYDLPTTPWRAVSRHAIGFTAGASTPAAKRWDVQPKAIEGSSDTMVGDILDTLWLGVKGRNRWMDYAATLRHALYVAKAACMQWRLARHQNQVPTVLQRHARGPRKHRCGTPLAISASVRIEQGAISMPSVRNEPLAMLAPTPANRCTISASACRSLRLSLVSYSLVISRLRGRRGDASRCQVHGASEAPARRNDARRARNADDDPRPVTRPAAHEVVHDLGSLEAVRRE
jgi:hypothetical protein